MIKLKVNNKKFNIPNNLNELTIEKYQDIKSIKNSDKKKYINTVLESFGIDRMSVRRMNTIDVIKVADAITVMLNDGSQEVQNIIKVDDIKYQFEKNLKDLRFDQFIDLSELTDDEQIISDNIHIIAAILYRPIIGVKKERFKLKHLRKKRKFVNNVEEYDSNNVLERAELFRQHMTMDVVYGLLFFFLNLRMKLLKNSLESLKNQIK